MGSCRMVSSYSLGSYGRDMAVGAVPCGSEREGRRDGGADASERRPVGDIICRYETREGDGEYNGGYGTMGLGWGRWEARRG